MGATASTTALGKLPRRSGTPAARPGSFTILAALVTAPVVAFLGFCLVTRWNELEPLAPTLLVWFLVVAVADLMPVPYWGKVSLTMSLPVLLAAGMVFAPWIATLLAFAGSVDIREVRRRIPFMTALFNRSQIAIAVFAASWVFRALSVSVSDWPEVLAPALLAFGVDATVNVAAVVVAGAFKGRIPLLQALREFGREGGWPFLLGYVCYGLTALILAATFTVIGSWGLIAFVLPLVVSRQMFSHGQMLAEASREALARNRMLVEISERIAEERADERRRVAAALHDEVLPPLFKVHLMGEVLRRELETGRLLAMEEDFPVLLRSTDAASNEIRAIIKNLRRSALGADGLESTLRLLVDDVSLETNSAIEHDISPLDASPLIQLLIYQVAREALSNAVRHAAARRICLRLYQEGSWARLVVEDDGVGFGLLEARRRGDHFGLRLMEERAAAVGGLLLIDSEPGGGTRVVGRFPTEVRLANE